MRWGSCRFSIIYNSLFTKLHSPNMTSHPNNWPHFVGVDMFRVKLYCQGPLIRRIQSGDTARHVMLSRVYPHTHVGVRHDTIRYGPCPIPAGKKTWKKIRRFCRKKKIVITNVFVVANVLAPCTQVAGTRVARVRYDTHVFGRHDTDRVGTAIWGESPSWAVLYRERIRYDKLTCNCEDR